MKNIFLIGAAQSNTSSLINFFDKNEFSIQQVPLFVNQLYLKKYEKRQLIRELFKDNYTLVSNPSCFSDKKYIDNLHDFIKSNNIQNYIIVVLLRNSVDAFKSFIKHRLIESTISGTQSDVDKLQADCVDYFQYYEKLRYLYECFDDFRIKVIFSEDLHDRTNNDYLFKEFKSYFPEIKNLKLPIINNNKKPIMFKPFFRFMKELLIISKLYSVLSLLPAKHKLFFRKTFYKYMPKANIKYEINYSSHYLNKLDNNYMKTKQFIQRRNITDKIIIDLDKTLCHSVNKNYPEAKPNIKIIENIHKYKDQYRIVIFTSRNMKTYKSNIDLIKNTLPIIIKWLNTHNVFYDEIIVGKPWCGENGFYVDDKSVRPDEFQNLHLSEITKLIDR